MENMSKLLKCKKCGKVNGLRGTSKVNCIEIRRLFLSTSKYTSNFAHKTSIFRQQNVIYTIAQISHTFFSISLFILIFNTMNNSNSNDVT